MMSFADRRDAGRQLARHLSHHARPDTLVLGLPRGGVPVAAEVARGLGAELDVLVARKIGAPGRPELGVGAIAEGGEPILDDQTLRLLGLARADLEDTITAEREEVYRRVERYRGNRPLPDVEGRTVVVVDDGLATGVTARASLRALRARAPGRLVLAAPVGSPDTAAALGEDADEVVVVHTPEHFAAVGQWYENFAQVDDEEVRAALGAARGSP